MIRMPIFALALGLAAPGLAQSAMIDAPDIDTGTRFKKEVVTPQRTEARDMQKRVARCAAYRNKELARSFVENSDPVGIAFDAIVFKGDNLADALKVAECISRAMKHSTYRMQMHFQYTTLRALMAEEVYLMDNAAPIALAANAEKLVTGRNYDSLSPRAYGMSQLADCLVFENVSASDALLRSTIGSDAEEAALESLYPALQTCGLDPKSGMTLDYSMIRQVVADGLWARSHYDGADAPGQDDDDA